MMNKKERTITTWLVIVIVLFLVALGWTLGLQDTLLEDQQVEYENSYSIEDQNRDLKEITNDFSTFSEEAQARLRIMDHRDAETDRILEGIEARNKEWDRTH